MSLKVDFIHIEFANKGTSWLQDVAFPSHSKIKMLGKQRISLLGFLIQFIVD